MTRQYSSISVETTLASSLSNNGTTMIVAAGTAAALLGGVTLAAGNVDIFTVAIDPDTASEEIVFITANSGNDFTIVRGQAGSTAIVHNSGATVRHVLTSSDLIYFRNGVIAVDDAILKTIVDAKGDLIAATGADAVARVALGSNGQVLTADSTQAAGVRWSTPTTLDLTINAKTADYTFVAGDINKLITMSSASTTTFTVPNGIFSVGQQINVQGIGAGLVQIRNDGTTVLTSNAATSTAPNLRAQYSAATIICTSSNNFTVIGDLA
jgi:trimeric autotransporter adhesin